MWHRNKTPLDDFKGSVAANGSPSIFLEGGPTYDRIQIESNISPQHLTFVLELNGTEIVDILGTHLVDDAAYMAYGAETNFYNLAFEELMARVAEVQGLTGLPTYPEDRIKLTVRIGATSVGSPFVKGIAHTSPARERIWLPRIQTIAIPITKTGENNFAMDRGERLDAFRIRRAHIYGDVTKVRIMQDDFKRFEMLAAENTADLKYHKKVPITGAFTFDTAASNNAARDLFDTYSRKSLKAYLTTSDADDLTMVQFGVQQLYFGKELEEKLASAR